MPSVATAATLQVGPGKPYDRVSEALAAASPGDVIEVDPGEYVDDVATITTGDLTIRGVGGTRPHLRATQPIANLKGIFAIEVGTGPIVVEGLEFSGAFIEGNGDNAAGIRMQGESLVVRDCYFHDNQNGILSGGTPDYDITIESSEFGHNGNPGSGQEHNVYVSGDTRLFVFRGNYSHHAYSGHTLKSRARETHILYNRFSDEAEGSSSYLIDLPNGNLAYVIGNVIQQGPMAENTGSLLRYNAEDAAGPDNRLFVVHNTFVNDNSSMPGFVRAGNTDQASVVLRNNLLIGAGTLWAEEGGAATVVDEGNLQTDTPDVIDATAYDYRINPTSPAVDAGVEAGDDGAFSLAPEAQYVHPYTTVARPSDGAPDVGAYEWSPDEPPGGTTSGGGESSGGDDTGQPDPTGAAESSTSGDPSSGSSGWGSGATPDPGADQDGGQGGGCSTDRPAQPGWLLLGFGIGLLTVRRRRRDALSESRSA